MTTKAKRPNSKSVIDAQEIGETVEALEFRAVVVDLDDTQSDEARIIAAFLTMDEAREIWTSERLKADHADEWTENEGFRGAVLLYECCRSEDAGTYNIAYGSTKDEAATNYLEGRTGLRSTSSAASW